MPSSEADISVAFLQLVARSTVASLKTKFPLEFNCFRAMHERSRKGRAIVSSNFLTFKQFLEAVGPMPSPGFTVDRINYTDPEYAPGKVRWASKREQANNRSNTLTLRDVHGTVRTCKEWAKLTGQKPNTIRARKARGWSDQEALAGKKLTTTNQTPSALKAAEWPAGLTPKRWEAPYQIWLRNGYNKIPGSTRAAFALWVEGNRARAMLKVLARRYPAYFGDEAVDDGLEMPAYVLADEQFKQFELHHDLHQSFLKTCSVKERDAADHLRRYHDAVTDLGSIKPIRR